AERLKSDWTSTTCAFFDPTPSIEYINGCRVYVFMCNTGANPRHVNRYLGTKDASSTSNLRKHAKICYGEDAVKAADACGSLQAARNIVQSGLKNQPLTAMLERAGGKGKVTYSHTQHTTAERRAEIVHWVAESRRPFSIVKDRGFESLMKTGRPGIHIPSPATVSRNVKMVFVNARRRISKLLKEHDGALHFATDAWTSLNH
ncbi:hypothetical protein CPC08DRAFT_609670, partial [Agrocybe pediades]